MKLKNKFLIILFILVLALCLAFVSSASNYIDYSEIHNSSSGNGLVLTYFSDENDFDSTLSERLGVIVVASSLDSDFIYSFGFSNVEYWNILLRNISSEDEFLSFIESGIDSGYWNSTMNMYKLLTQYYQEFWLAYQNWYNNDFYYSLVDCQNFHILKNMCYTFGYNGVTYNSVIEQYCPKCNFSNYELSSDILNFLDVFLTTATDDEILNFDFYNTLKFYIFEIEGANVSNVHILDEFVDKLEKATIIKSNQYVEDWLESEGMLTEPTGITGEIEDIGFLLDTNVLPSFDRIRFATIQYSIEALENWLLSKDLPIKDYSRDFTVNDIDRLIAANFDSAYSNWVKAGRSDAILRLSQWLHNNLTNYSVFDNDGLLSDIDNGLNLNVLPALYERQAIGYSNGQAAGVSVGKTQMYNELMGHINTSFGTEFATSDGSSYDFTVPSQAYTVAYEAGELYQINKFTDDGGISDFLADISGTVLSTFFYLGTNISFMGTTALSLISLFVIAAIVIFVLKFFNKG